MATFLYRLGHFSVRRRRLVLLGWVTALVVIAGLAAAAGGETDDDFSLPGTESQEAFDRLDEKFPAQGGSSTQVVFATDGALADPANAAVIDAAVAATEQIDGVSWAASPSENGQFAPDGDVALGEVHYADSVLEVETATSDAVADAFQPVRDAGITVEFGGAVIPGDSMEPPSSEAIGLLVAAVVLLVSFGSVLAMGLPLVTALLGLGIGMSAIGLFSAIVDLTSMAPTLAVMLGLAVGIDYALFVVTRHRQNLALGLDVAESAARANATAGSAVVFAGITVMIAISGLAIVRMPFVTTMGVAAAGTVAVAVLVAISLLPALLGFVGHNIDRFRVPGLKNRTGGVDEGETLGSRWAAKVTSKPAPWLVGSLVVMIVLALPMADMHLGFPDAGTESTDRTQRRAYDLVADAFGPGFNGPMMVVADLDGASDPDAAVGALAGGLGEVDGVALALPGPVNDTGDTGMVTVIPTTGPADTLTEDLVHRIRDDARPGLEADTGTQFFISGSTVATIDVSEKLGGALVPFMVLVIGLTVILLMAVFRSIFVPIKAAIAILLSIGASFGVVVAVFQWGWLAELIGVHESIPVISFLPMMLFSILFGLSMDYEVFILTRIHEEYHRTNDARGSVLTGLTASARVITAAALIMISVFAAFILGDDAAIKMVGLGLAVAVLLDATIVRMIIVPATMTLLGDRAWTLPRWLDRILPNLDVEGRNLVIYLEARDAEAATPKVTEDEPSLV